MWIGSTLDAFPINIIEVIFRACHWQVTMPFCNCWKVQFHNTAAALPSKLMGIYFSQWHPNYVNWEHIGSIQTKNNWNKHWVVFRVSHWHDNTIIQQLYRALLLLHSKLMSRYFSQWHSNSVNWERIGSMNVPQQEYNWNKYFMWVIAVGFLLFSHEYCGGSL